MEYDVKKFAHFLVLKYSKLNYIHTGLTRSLNGFTNDVILKDIFTSIDILFKHYREIIDEIDIKELDNSILSSKELYMKHLVSKCLQLSGGDPTFYEFLLVCVYICKIAECLSARYKCWKILKLTADCLEAAYCRKFWMYFKENNVFSGLSYFCQKSNKSFQKLEVGIWSSLSDVVEWNKKVKNLKHLNDAGEDISLNTLEEKRLVDKPFLKPYPCDFPGSNDFLIESIELDEDASGCELKESEVVSEKVSKTRNLDADSADCKMKEWEIVAIEVNETRDLDANTSECKRKKSEVVSKEAACKTRNLGGDTPECELKEWEVVSKEKCKTGFRCRYCKAECAQYPFHLADEFPGL